MKSKMGRLRDIQNRARVDSSKLPTSRGCAAAVSGCLGPDGFLRCPACEAAITAELAARRSAS